MESALPDYQHRRYNPLSDEWVLVCPHRMNRPWQGHTEQQTPDAKSSLISLDNPLKPGGKRPNGITNPIYDGTFIFENDFPAMKPVEPELLCREKVFQDDDLFKCEIAEGKCFVMCFHPDSTVTLATMTCSEIAAVIKKLAELCLELQQKYEWIQVFENKGAIMGCSNPHPHCQIWASSFLPTEPSKKDEMQKKYFEKHKRILLMDYIKRELNYKVRVVVESEKWACLVPFWAVWPFETYLIPKRHCLRLQNLDNEEIEDLASMLKKLLCKYDNLFQTSFPYSMGWHGAPSGKYLNKKNDDGEDACFHWQLHATFLPPLLRSSTVKKFMVGYEMLAEAQRDLTPEKAADILRNLSTIHYKDQ